MVVAVMKRVEVTPHGVRRYMLVDNRRRTCSFPIVTVFLLSQFSYYLNGAYCLPEVHHACQWPRPGPRVEATMTTCAGAEQQREPRLQAHMQRGP